MAYWKLLGFCVCWPCNSPPLPSSTPFQSLETGWGRHWDLLLGYQLIIYYPYWKWCCPLKCSLINERGFIRLFYTCKSNQVNFPWGESCFLLRQVFRKCLLELRDVFSIFMTWYRWSRNSDEKLICCCIWCSWFSCNAFATQLFSTIEKWSLELLKRLTEPVQSYCKQCYWDSILSSVVTCSRTPAEGGA